MENRPEPVPVIPVMVIAGAPAVLFRAFTSPPPPGTSSRRSSESLPARTARLGLPGTPPIGPEPRYLHPVGTHRQVASGAGSSGVAISGRWVLRSARAPGIRIVLRAWALDRSLR